MHTHVKSLPWFAACACVFAAVAASAQQNGGWRAAGGEQNRYGNASGDVTPLAPTTPARSTSTAPARSSDLTPIRSGPQRAQVTDRAAQLPNTAGQVFRDYDIRPYTLRATGTGRPEQSIVDWILRETGYEAWHTQPVGLLSATRETLSVYHTPEMHALVADIVDRFVNTRSDQTAFSLRVATVRNPNWRARALPLMTPIPVQSPGVQGWLLAKEDAALLLSEFTRRSDYREYNSAGQLISSGQTAVVSTMRPRSYIKGIVPTAQTWPGYQPEMGQLEEGFTLEFSPLLALDAASADAIVKLRLNQVEKMVPVKLDMPSIVAPNQRVEVEVPQMTTANLHERFRWPTEKVLLLSMGVVATPTPGGGNALTEAVPMLKKPPRADALLMVECKGSLQPAVTVAPTARTAVLPARSFQGRY